MAQKLSISDASSDMHAFLKREWRLVLPVALALMGLPAVIFNLAAPADWENQVAQGGLAGWKLLLIATSLVSLAGALSIIALALIPTISVAEAIGVGARRFGVSLVANFVLGLAIGLPGGVLLAMAALLGRGAFVFAAVAILVVVLMLAARLVVLPALVVGRAVGPIQALRQSWALTRGQAGRILAGVLLLLIGLSVVNLALTAVFGALGAALGLAFGIATLGAIVTAVVGGLASAITSAIFYAFVAMIYRRLLASSGA